MIDRMIVLLGRKFYLYGVNSGKLLQASLAGQINLQREVIMDANIRFRNFAEMID